MSRAVYRFRAYTVVPDTEPDAEPFRHRMQCAVCGATGPETGTAEVAARWALAHLRAAPEHVTCRELITRPYRAVLGAWR